nr:EOG090X0AW0 [Eurycercus lamellatus]
MYSISMATSRAILTFSKFRYLPFNLKGNSRVNISSSCCCSSSSSYNPGYSRDPGELFFKDEVQSLLHRITGRDYDKIFRNKKIGQQLEAPKYQLLTQEELDELMAVTEEKVKFNLKMPPLIKEREPVSNVLSNNPELKGFDTAKYVFIDVTLGVSNSKRPVVVRDPDGVLRQASWEERQKVCQIYFPTPGRQVHVPKMFDEEFLENCLSRGDYEFLLDRACAQFEPDDPNYIRVTRKTYDCVNKTAQYDTLRSTRHFGPLVLHLVLSKEIDDLLFNFISRKELGAAVDLVNLFHIVESGATTQNMDDYQLIENFIQGHALKKSALELAWETFIEIEKQRHGYRCFKAVMFLTGFVFANFIVYIICLQEEDLLPSYGNLGVALGTGFMFGLITMLVHYVGLFVIGLHTGVLLGIIILCVVEQHFHIDTMWMSVGILLGSALVLAILTLNFQKAFTIIGTSLMGGAVCAAALDYYVENLKMVMWMWDRIKLEKSADPCWFSWLLLSVWPFMVVMGSGTQTLITAKDYYHDYQGRTRYSPPRPPPRPSKPLEATQPNPPTRPRRYRYVYQVRTAHGDVISQRYIQALKKMVPNVTKTGTLQSTYALCDGESDNDKAANNAGGTWNTNNERRYDSSHLH